MCHSHTVCVVSGVPECVEHNGHWIHSQPLNTGISPPLMNPQFGNAHIVDDVQIQRGRALNANISVAFGDAHVFGPHYGNCGSDDKAELQVVIIVANPHHRLRCCSTLSHVLVRGANSLRNQCNLYDCRPGDNRPCSEWNPRCGAAPQAYRRRAQKLPNSPLRAQKCKCGAFRLCGVINDSLGPLAGEGSTFARIFGHSWHILVDACRPQRP